jgi:carboxyl-terminal processing protease
MNRWSAFSLPFLVLSCASAASAPTLVVAGDAADEVAFAAPPRAPAVAAADAPFRDGARTFAAVKEGLLSRYGSAVVTDDDLYRAAVRGMLEHVDDKHGAYNKLLTPDEISALRNDLRGEVVGVGVEIQFDPATGYSDVLNVLPGSPAEHAGLVPGDKILDVDGEPFKGKTQRDVLAKIRGNAGQAVSLNLLRGDKVLEVSLVRQLVAYPVATDGVLPGKIGYLRIRSFNAKTPGAVGASLGNLASQGARSLIIDLRSNPGGTFDDAITTADKLLPAGASVVRLEEKGEPPKTTSVKQGATALANVPVLVLVNGDTASSAEFLAAALHDARKATTVGQKTFGKWTVQTLDDLPNGYAVKYTVAVFSTPSGASFDGVGLSPDIEVDLDHAGFVAAERAATLVERVAVDPQLRSALGLVRARSRSADGE